MAITARTPRQMQRGAALLIALLLLVILTVGGVASMRSSILQERMGGNARDRSVAFQASEAAIRSGESYLAGFTSQPTPAAASYFYDDGSAPDWDTIDCSPPPSVSTVTVSPPATGACFIIEEAEASTSTVSETGTPDKTRKVYKITGLGNGISERTQVVIRTSYLW